MLFHRNNNPQIYKYLNMDSLYWLNQSLCLLLAWFLVLSRHSVIMCCLFEVNRWRCFWVRLFFVYCRCRSNYLKDGGLLSHSLVYPWYIFVPTEFPSTCCLFFKDLKRDVVVCFVDIGGFSFHHCLIFLSINTNFIVFGLSPQGIKFMIYHPNLIYTNESVCIYSSHPLIRLPLMQ